MEKKEYPFQNRELKNLSGEKWKDIPELEGYYMISNFGRVKRLEYVLEYSDGRVYVKKSMINKPILATATNHL